MTNQERAIERMRSQIALRLVLKRLLAYVTLWAFVYGTAVLVLRAAIGVSPWPLLWGVLLVPVLIGLAVWQVWRQLPSRSAVRAFLDRQSGCGGLLMAAEEQDLNGWQATLPPLVDVRLRWDGRRSLALFLAGAVYVLIGFLVPQSFVAPSSAQALEIGGEVDKLSAQIDTLKEESVLEPERADSLKEKLKQLKDEASGTNPVKTLEALDHIAELAQKTANEAAEKSIQEAEKLSKAESLAEGLNEAGKEIAPKTLTEAMSDLAEMLKKAEEETGLVDKNLDPKTLAKCKKGTLTPEELKEIVEALKKGKKGLCDKVGKLCDAKLIDPDKLAECDKACECTGGELAAFLKEQSVKFSPYDPETKKKITGRGGLNKGPGHTDLTWKDKSSEEGVTFKEEALPPAALAALKDSQRIGQSKGAPDQKAGGSSSNPGALQSAAAGGGSANTQTLLPRHKSVVERYFERRQP